MRHITITNNDAVWIALAVLIPAVLYLVHSAYRTRQQMAMRKAVIDKFSSAEDFAAFLQSPAGQSFVSGLSYSESPLTAVINSIQRGIILLVLGGGVWRVGITLESAAEVASIGILLLSVGVGILVSAGISYHLSKTWGLIGENPGDRTKAAGNDP